MMKSTGKMGREAGGTFREFRVHGSFLLDRERGELSQAAVEHDRAGEDREDFEHNLDFFHLLW